jgi:hypothetical protein
MTAGARRFEAAFPSHRTAVYDDASHFLQEDVGDRVAASQDIHPRGGLTLAFRPIQR